MKNYIGVDVGGTSISAGRVENEKIVCKSEVSTPVGKPIEDFLVALYYAIDQVKNEDTVAIGVGVPGYLDIEEGRVKYIFNIPSLKDVSIKNELNSKYGIPVYVNNDANCFALGVSSYGVGKQYKNIVAITLGTGLGGGIVADNKVVSGVLGGCGELGAIRVMGSNFDTICGSKFFAKHNTTGYELFQRAEAGDAKALDLFTSYGMYLSQLVHTIVSFVAPEAIIFGGEISKSFKYFKEPVLDVVRCLPAEGLRKGIHIHETELENIGVLGAASLCEN